MSEHDREGNLSQRSADCARDDACDFPNHRVDELSRDLQSVKGANRDEGARAPSVHKDSIYREICYDRVTRIGISPEVSPHPG